MFLSFCVFEDFFCFQKIRVWDILGPPYCVIGATIRIVQEMLCPPSRDFTLALHYDYKTYQVVHIRCSVMLCLTVISGNLPEFVMYSLGSDLLSDWT